MENHALPTRDRLLETAVTLMRRTGLAGAAINEIVRASGAPKGSVYHHFPGGKQQIVLEGLDQYSAQVMKFIDTALSSKREPREKVKALFNAFAQRIEQGDFRHSCPAGTVCLDLDQTTDALRPGIAAAFTHYLDAIEAHFPFSSAQRSRSFAGMLLTAIEGAYVRGRADRSGQPFREAGAWLAVLADPPARPAARRR